MEDCENVDPSPNVGSMLPPSCSPAKMLPPPPLGQLADNSMECMWESGIHAMDTEFSRSDQCSSSRHQHTFGPERKVTPDRCTLELLSLALLLHHLLSVKDGRRVWIWLPNLRFSTSPPPTSSVWSGSNVLLSLCVLHGPRWSVFSYCGWKLMRVFLGLVLANPSIRSPLCSTQTSQRPPQFSLSPHLVPAMLLGSLPVNSSTGAFFFPGGWWRCCCTVTEVYGFLQQNCNLLFFLLWHLLFLSVLISSWKGVLMWFVLVSYILDHIY